MKCSSRMRQTLFARVDTGASGVLARASKGSCEYCRTSHFSSLVVRLANALFRVECAVIIFGYAIFAAASLYYVNLSLSKNWRSFIYFLSACRACRALRKISRVYRVSAKLGSTIINRVNNTSFSRNLFHKNRKSSSTSMLSSIFVMF